MHKKIARRRTFVLSASTKAKYRDVGTRKCRSKHLSPNRGTGLRVRRAPTEDASPETALRVHARRNGSGNGPYAARLRGVRRVVRFRCDLGPAAGCARGSSETLAWPAARRAPSAERVEGTRRSVFLVKHHRLVRISRSGTVPFGACPCTMADRLAGAGIERAAIRRPSRDADAGFRTRGADSGSPFGAHPVSAATLLRGIRHRAPAHGVRTIGRSAW